MTLDQMVLFVHLFAASLWLGGGLGVGIFALRAEASGDPGRMLQVGKEVEWFGSRVLMPSAAVVLATGLILAGMMASFGEPWIIFSLLAFAASTTLALIFLGPRPGVLGELIAEHGGASPVVQARIRRHFLYNRLELLILVSVLIDMVIKPGS
jgi:uncharacterized membrane protein